jgi:hypothetical protein
MRSTHILGGALAAACLWLASCGGGGGGSSGSSSSSSSGGPNPGPTIFTLAVVTQPAGATAATAFATQPVVHVRSGTITSSIDNTTVVTASIAAGTGAPGATLTGTSSVTVVSGVATFTNLGISAAGTGYQLQYSAPRMVGAPSNSFDVAAGPAPVVQVNFAIDSSQDVRPISRFIYGMNGWDPASRPANLTLSRSGGNRMTAYNWETNASNAGSDFQNQNDDFLGGGNTPNGAVAHSIESARAAGAGIVVTVPTLGYVAADKNGGGDVNQTPNYLAVRFRQSLPRKGAPFSLAPDTADAFVYQDEYVNFLDQTYAGAFAAANNPIFLSMDNEPDLWHTTHARLRGDAVNPPATQHGTNVTYAEIVQRTRDYANAAKAVNPAVTIFGPVNYGWQGYIRLQDAADANNRDFLDFFLQQMAAAQATDGRRVLDVLDVHWYPEARGACANPDPNDSDKTSCRVTTDVTQAGTVAARKQAPRSLWDPAYKENSRIAEFSTQGPIRLIPRLREKIAANYPGTRLAITEYNYGGANDISGAIAQADVLGIFGREGLFAANLWRLSNNNNFLYGAFEMFRNYDGANGSFGDTSIRATNSDAVAASVYASVDAGNAARMVMVAINKNDTALTAGIAVTHGTQFHTARVYRLTSASSQPQRQADIAITQSNAFQYTMPANSVTTLVLLP